MDEPRRAITIRAVYPDPTAEPLCQGTLDLYLARGMPSEAIHEDRTLDPAILAEHGWLIIRGGVLGPRA